MLERVFFIVVVLIFAFNGEIIGQEKNVENFSSLIHIQSSPKTPTPSYVHWIKQNEAQVVYQTNGQYFFKKIPETVAFSLNAPLSKDFYCNHLSFFCRKELQIEKAISIPLRFRLGSVQYTDYLERKPNATWNK